MCWINPQFVSKPTRLITMINRNIQAGIIVLTISLLAILMLLTWWIYQIDLTNITQMVMSHKKEIIVSMLDHVIEQIEHERNIFKAQGKSTVQCQEYLKIRLNNIRFLDGSGYIFVVSYDGIELVNPAQPSLIGKDISHFTDSNGVQFVQKAIQYAQKPEGGFLQCQWVKPGHHRKENKLVYVRGVNDWRWAVGTGIYLDDLNRTISHAKKHFQYYLITELLVIIVAGALVMIFMLLMAGRVARMIRKEMTLLTNDLYTPEKTPHSFDARYQIDEFREIARKSHHALTRVIQLQNNLQGVFDNVEELFIILDFDGKIIAHNATVTDRLAYASKELINQPITMIFAPADRQKIEQIIYHIRAGILPDSMAMPVIKKDGTIIDSESRIVNGQWNGKPALLFVSKDITDIKRSKARLENIINGSHVGTWEWNFQTNEIVFNEHWAKMLGYTLAELAPVTTQTFIDRCHTEDFPKLEKKLYQHFNGENSIYEEECRMKHKDGSWIWLRVRGQLISRTVDGDPLFMVGTHTDITTRKHNEETLRKTLLETERVNKLMEGREQRIIELKKEVNALLKEKKQMPKYRSVA